MATTLKMIPFLDIQDEIGPLVSRCPPSAIERALRNAAREFCRATLIWRYSADTVPVAVDENIYHVPVPPESINHRVLEVEYRGTAITEEGRRPLYAVTETQLRLYYGQGRDYHNRFTMFYKPSDWKVATGEPYFFLHENNADDIRIVPIPIVATTEGLHTRAAVMPSREATRFPAWILEHYYRTLAIGTQAILHAMPDEAWTDKAKAVVLQTDFDLLVGRGMADVFQSHTTAQQTVSPEYPLDR